MRKVKNQQKVSEYKDWKYGKITLFLISGKISAGKSTVAKMLKSVLKKEKEIPAVNIASFAKYVKDVARESFGWDGKKDARGRKLLQVVGTDAGRMYNKNIWVKKAYNAITENVFPPSVIIYDDWRFPNEYSYFVGKPLIGDIYKIRVYGKNGKTSEHLSEKALEIFGIKYDYLIPNFGSLEELKEEVSKMVKELL